MQRPQRQAVGESANRNPFPHNQIPSSIINPVSQKVITTFFPATNVPNADPLDTSNNYRVNDPQPITTNLYDIRGDQVLTNSQSLFVRCGGLKKLTSQTPRNLGDSEDTILIRKVLRCLTTTPFARIC